MHLIITDPWLAKQRPIHLNGVQLIGLVVSMLTVMGLLALLIYHSLFVYGARQGWPVITPMVQMLTSQQKDNQDRYLRENLDAMARKLGELQARQLQLDSLGERVASLAGLSPRDFKPPAGAGGALVSPQDWSMNALQSAMSAMDTHALGQSDKLAYVESQLFSEKMRKSMLPTAAPIPGVATGSGFGWRIDPLTGQRAMHTGLDFPAEVGTPILAAAGGMVVTQEFHPAYGNMIEIDHGNELITRYAHASRVMVKKGDIVRRGQPIAEVGVTGRTTGPHLHFEVWHNGVVLNPQSFLQAGDTQLAKLPAMPRMLTAGTSAAH
jgi:murein DD-endopeptidase MepM/ murein hydrolase activator NlpD